jgi:hypothetical protein
MTSHEAIVAAKTALQMLKGTNFSNHPRGAGVPRGFIETTWVECTRLINEASQQSDEAVIAAANEATAVLNAIGSLDIEHWNALGAQERRASAGHGGHIPEEAAAVRAAIASNSVLAAFYAKVDQREAQMVAEREETARLQAEQRERDAPAVLLAALRLAGVNLALSADGKHLVLPPAQMARLTLEEIEEIRLHRPALVTLLKADAEAARPVVVA